MQEEPNNLAILRGEVTKELKENGGGTGLFEVTTTVFHKEKMYKTPHRIKVAGRAVPEIAKVKLGHIVKVEGEIHLDHIFLLRFFNFSLVGPKESDALDEGGGSE